MVENLGFRNKIDKEEMKTKEKMQAFSQGFWQPFHAPLAPPICVSISKSQPIILSNPKRGKTTMNGGEDPRWCGRAFQHPQHLSRGSPSTKKCFSIMQNEESNKTLKENMIKYAFLTY